jgi:DME family drug/metabolite transporter
VLVGRRHAGWAALPWRWVLLAGACMAGYNLSFFAGVKSLGVAVGTAIAIGSGPVWAGLLQMAASRRPPAPAWWAGTLLAVAGGAAMVLQGGEGAPVTPRGLLLCLAAGLSYAVSLRQVSMTQPLARGRSGEGEEATRSLRTCVRTPRPLPCSHARRTPQPEPPPPRHHRG